MANHSAKEDNYVAKKTWDEAMKDAAASKKPEGRRREPDRNEARKNGGGSDSKSAA